MFENPRRGRQARNLTTNVSKILDLKSSSEQIFFRKLSLGAPANWSPASSRPGSKSYLARVLAQDIAQVLARVLARILARIVAFMLVYLISIKQELKSAGQLNPLS